MSNLYVYKTSPKTLGRKIIEGDLKLQPATSKKVHEFCEFVRLDCWSELKSVHERTHTRNNSLVFLRSKKVPFLAQVLSLERKCRYVCYWCLLWDITASGV